MSGVSRKDRAAIENLAKLTGGSGLSSNLRDASGGSRRSEPTPWKSEAPTVIPPPTNRPSKTSASLSAAAGPYSKSRFATATTPVGNPNKKLSYSRPTKRPRVDSGPSPSKRVASGASSGTGHLRPLLAPETLEPETIIVDDYPDEDIGIPVRREDHSSPDPLNLGASSRSNRPKKLPVEHPPIHPFDHDVAERVDGRATEKYRKEHAAAQKREGAGEKQTGKGKGRAPEEPEIISDSEPDPILDFEESPSLSQHFADTEPTRTSTPSKTAMPNVGELATLFGPPHIDLRKAPGRATMKSMMKPRQKPVSKSAQRDPVATSTSLLPASPFPKIKQRAPASQSRKKGQGCLPILRFALGTKLFPLITNAEDAPHIYWNHPRPGYVCIKEGPPLRPNRQILQFQPDREVELMTSLSPPLVQEMDPLIMLKFLPSPAKSPLRDLHRDYFEPGSKEKGRLVLKFSKRNHEEFLDLVRWLRAEIDEADFVDGKGANAIWEVVDAGRASESQKRVGALVTLRHNARSSVTPDLLYEEESHLHSSRPVPKPAYAGASKPTSSAGPSHRFTRHSTAESTRRPASLEIDDLAARSYAPRIRRPSPPPDPDEIILIYPPAGAGAVNLSRADLKRLQPGEFLNDTLIEFGLKLWHNELREKNPEFADQIHVFNSFFYKKLCQKSPEDGYQSVRKWTSRFDLFEKNYIIVPINENLHWYLAVICYPKHILSPTPSPVASPSVTTRSRKRLSDVAPADGATEAPLKSAAHDTAPSSPTKKDEDDSIDAFSQTQDDKDVADTLLQFSSCSISATEGSNKSNQDISNKQKSADTSGLLLIPEEKEAAGGSSRVPAPAEMEVDDPLPRESGRVSPTASETGAVIAADKKKPVSPTSLKRALDDAVSESDFYAPVTSSKKGKQKMPLPVDIDSPEPEPEPEPPVVEVVAKPEATEGFDSSKTYIFTLDSLGSRHPSVLNNLRKYLKKEAEDKKNIMDASDAIGKQALVPDQPNHCDCGIYLLHFAKTFMKDPHRYVRLICERKPTSKSQAHRKEEWEDDQTLMLREELIAHIESLSELWKKERAAKEEQRKKDVAEGKEVAKVESSDSDIDIEDVTPAPAPSPPKTPSTRSRTKAQRIRG